MNLQSQLHETEQRNSYLREQVDAFLNQNRILSSKLTNFNDLNKIFSSQSSPIDLRVASLATKNEKFPTLPKSTQVQVPTSILVDVSTPLVDIT